ncbi:hypothetical protein ERO13_A13G151932v2 [Gossypium hirsutum]|nr:hypothetical protein ERO13_A13G151932v2 [Gossypium hirsutum]
MSRVQRITSANGRLKNLMNQTDNRICADCGAPDPKWASANIGVFICLKCCGVHRNLGARISKVRNSSANAIYEAYIPEGYSKPGPDSTHGERSRFIRSKYELQEFLKSSLRITSRKSSASIQSSFSTKILDSFRIKSSKEPNIWVTEGQSGKRHKFSHPDMLTSDPYVVLTLGKQTIQTAVIKSNLNPVWNEELMLSVPQNFGPVKLQVYDYDTFSADDIMGEAEIDIQPLITSAMIGKWLKSQDNALIEDSIQVSLKLQNVECGEIYLQLEWLPLDQ